MQSNCAQGTHLRRTAGADLSSSENYIVMLNSSDEVVLHDGSNKQAYLLFDGGALGDEVTIIALNGYSGQLRAKSSVAHTIHTPVYLDTATGKVTGVQSSVRLGFAEETKAVGAGDVAFRPDVLILPRATAAITAGATPSFAPSALNRIQTLTPAEDETIAAVTTDAITGEVYFLKVVTSGTTSHTLTFGSNFKKTGTLATGTADAKTFLLGFLFDGTNFVEVSRTTAM